jgi:hypothetical protein
MAESEEDYEYDYSDDENYPVESDDGGTDDEGEKTMDWHPSQDAENPNAAPMMVVQGEFKTALPCRFLRHGLLEIERSWKENQFLSWLQNDSK